MKRLTLLLLMLLNSLDIDASVTIRIEASFGSKRKECRGGVGLCSASRVRNEHATDGVITLSLSEDESTLTLMVSRTSLDNCEGQIASGQFIQEEDFLLPSEISAALGISGLLTIPAGRYPAVAAGETITITIAVSNTPGGMK